MAHARTLLAPLATYAPTANAVDDAARAVAFDALQAALPAASRAFHAAVAAELLRTLERPEPFAGAHAPWAAVAPLVADALLDGCTWESAWRLLERSDAGAAVAAILLARLPSPLGPLGAGRLHTLASSPNAAHRAAAIAAITHDVRAVLTGPAATASLAELDHVDVRAAVTATLEGADARAFGSLQLALLLDATHEDVRACGLRLLQRALAAAPSPVDVADLLARCAKHPCSDVRRALLPIAAARHDVHALAALVHAAVFDPEADDDELATALDVLGAARVEARDAQSVVDVLHAVAWRGPGTVRDGARRIVAGMSGRFGDLVVEPLLSPSHMGAG